ncbi:MULTISPECIES: DUF2306 domain-containing protein [Brevibacillus]|jgi:uncharacterized membrane protein|uniref:DUF2306 domain-containing protein n=1 Tax=Brevibacillus TaxID=55080 RepID=UPI000F0884A5|nr:DUF2306 domain-containing protein [Brevibacillus borstelensis]MBE5396594.1 DUF2306 domain-containing protein [Brevibacillus borstelensis]MED1745662.1 DUF2306 domain-containing protein [Brevibacillus borstelensis]MED1876812.1 DUF2306 domain-containing protein [Brevibacillus borstelensis]MED1884971.1 DUF2306 domain-containing protein [Brevibacillus borstelensis]MED2010926.1 DUF2306 domain-containing protein [Brevibacillus borstelensis]
MAGFEFFRIIHIIAGFLALVVFWIPIVTKKGGKAHNRVGWVYVISMAAVAVSALYMGVWRIGFDPDRTLASVSFAWFLIYISLLSSATAWYGMRVLRFKKRVSAHRNPWDLLFPGLLFISSFFIGGYGYLIDSPLLNWFPLVGVFLGGTQLKYWLRPPATKMHWFFQHMSGMMGCCIATITAFTVFGAPRLLHLESVNPIIWFFPTIVITPVIVGMSVYYQKKFSKKPISPGK